MRRRKATRYKRLHKASRHFWFPCHGATTPFKHALKIRPAERDRELELDSVGWPHTIDHPNWDAADGYLHRVIEDIPSKAPDGKSSGHDQSLAVPLRESVLRFPSAPIHGVQRLHEYHSNLPVSENMHTYRVLTADTAPSKIRRIFLFHNGLNELDRIGLYYQLASHLINNNDGVACVLRPFPGHLTRAPFASFAEEPLERYLWDGSHLFRQFLRYMTETQWFLSALVKRSRYRCASGAALLAEHDKPAESRLNPDILTAEMVRAWERLYEDSDEILKDAHQREPGAAGMKPKPVDRVFHESITSLRRLLKLEAHADLGSDLQPDDDRGPSLHVIGYSLGGFAAQSVFMSWPFAIDSCSTLFSGGALRELSPTAFADPEEWQTVLHSLRYELDDGMLHGRYGRDENELAGLSRDLFLYFQRTFYEVFEQEYRGSFQSRLAAFRQRMLFIVGGDDPIVRPRSVLDSEPPGGINLLEIGGVGHFLGSKPKDKEEAQQRKVLASGGREINSALLRGSRRTACYRATKHLARPHVFSPRSRQCRRSKR